jgi:hypothetical protein
MKNRKTKLQTSEILHILRNPYGWRRDQVAQAQLQACDEIERWKNAYENLCQWCQENGLETTAYAQGEG